MKQNVDTEKDKDLINHILEDNILNIQECKGCPYKFSTNKPSCTFPVSSYGECFWKYYKSFIDRRKK